MAYARTLTNLVRFKCAFSWLSRHGLDVPHFFRPYRDFFRVMLYWDCSSVDMELLMSRLSHFSAVQLTISWRVLFFRNCGHTTMMKQKQSGRVAIISSEREIGHWNWRQKPSLGLCSCWAAKEEGNKDGVKKRVVDRFKRCFGRGGRELS